MFQYFRDTEKNIINDSTMELLGPLKLSEKYQIPEKFIYKILKHAGLKEIKPLEEPPEPMPLAKTPKKQDPISPSGSFPSFPSVFAKPVLHQNTF